MVLSPGPGGRDRAGRPPGQRGGSGPAVTEEQGTLVGVTEAAVAPDPVLTHASLTLLEASIAHARSQGSFHNATYLRESRDTLLPLAVRQHEQTTRPAAAAASPALHDVPRNAPCPCGSGLKYKRCHGMRAAA